MVWYGILGACLLSSHDRVAEATASHTRTESCSRSRSVIRAGSVQDCITMVQTEAQEGLDGGRGEEFQGSCPVSSAEMGRREFRTILATTVELS